MKKKAVSLFTGICLYMAGSTHAQFLSGQAPAGASTLILPGSTVGLNLPKDGELSFSLYSRPINPLIFGFTAAAKNQEGLGTLFDAGQFSPSASFKGAFGYSFNLIKGFRRNENEYNRLSRKLSDNTQALYKNIKATIVVLKTDPRLTANPKRAAFLADTLLILFEGSTQDKISTQFKTLANNPGVKFSDNEKAVINDKADEIDKLIINTNTVNNPIVNDRYPSKLELDNVIGKSILDLNLFIFLRQSASQFYTFDSLSTTAPVSSFKKQYYGRSDVGIGVNLRVGGWLWVGANYGWRRGNNLNLLVKDDYTTKTVNSTTTQYVTKEKKITAYQGSYQEFKQQFAYFDVLAVVNTSKRKKTRPFKPNDVAIPPKILLNPYLRLDFSGEIQKYPSVSTLGLTMLYRSRSRFLGGLYLEGADLSNSIEKFKAAKKPEIPELTPLYNRLSFGIITQFELISIFQ